MEENYIMGGGYVNALVLDCYWAGKTKRENLGVEGGVDMRRKLR